ncbi:5-dehydro-4-deoxy-D-glucuronate isomerase [Catenovulum sediminis]|uniref:4-deoxy-L-threo-5-hexosulose-uronate ketol-isomerase n=1 Tax=Catenovulum sediminis TaxID=1740262 RepID=A0ABV1REI2_9ALTE|nr:5-dehydro-4-deoxy-D-glucuronate isomerase [Catenovulum sediminis]
MSIQYESRYAIGPNEAKTFDTQKLRDAFLLQDLFTPEKIQFVYTHYERHMVGSAVPVKEILELTSIDPLKSEFFLSRRELGVVNVGGAGIVEVDGVQHELDNKEALYVGAGDKKVTFASKDATKPAKFYLNSAPAHHAFPDKKVTRETANVLKMGSPETCNQREIYQLIVREVVQTCQLQMGLTILKPGSVWNTMPAHQHDRRMEVYLYLDLPADQAVAHFMGEPHETRVIWVKNEQVVVSPPWSIHSGAGSSNYAFVWGMSGENLDYADMDKYGPADLT